MTPRLLTPQAGRSSSSTLLGILLSFLLLQTIQSSSSDIHTIVLQWPVNKTDIRVVNSTIEYVYQFTFNTTSRTNRLYSYDSRDSMAMIEESVRVHTSTTNGDIESPVLFVIREQKDVLSWPLPVLSNFDRKMYKTANRTLCGAAESESGNRTIYLSVSTAKRTNTTFTIEVSVEHNFVLKLNQSGTTQVAPLSPRFYRFVFPSSPMKRFVLLEVTSENDHCMTVSVQNASCPVLDQESNVQFEGYWQTMTRQAGMTLRKDDFPNGFFIVFVMHGDNSRCTKVETEEETEYSNVWNWFEVDDFRVKTVSFSVTEKISGNEYLAAIFGTVGIFWIFYVFSFVISCAYLCRNHPLPPPTLPIDDGPSGSNNGRNEPNDPVASTPILDDDDRIPVFPEDDDSPPHRRVTFSNNNPTNNSSLGPEEQHWLATSCDSSLDETDYDTLQDADSDKNIYRQSQSLFVAHLAKKNPKILAKKSQLYLWTLVTVAIFYGLPVVQLVFTYQKVIFTWEYFKVVLKIVKVIRKTIFVTK